MTTTFDRPPAEQHATATGPRECPRHEQLRRPRRRYRAIAAVAGAALAVAVLLTGVLGAGAGSPDAPARPAPGPAEPAVGDGSGAVAAPPPAEADERARVQLLNGVGAPGVAEAVAGLLPEGEFRVVVAGNAPEFGVRETRLLVYDDDPASLDTAERLREVLGAGTISVSRQPQSVVDVTVIIGRDVRGVS